jgi:hypothetical protein
MARTMLNEAKLSDGFWREAINIAIYILNRGKIIVNYNKTPYELWKGIPTTVKYFKNFGSKCYIKRYDEHLGKIDSRADECIFLGYSSRSKAYRCYNTILRKIIESSNVEVDESGCKNEKEGEGE